MRSKVKIPNATKIFPMRSKVGIYCGNVADRNFPMHSKVGIYCGIQISNINPGWKLLWKDPLAKIFPMRSKVGNNCGKSTHGIFIPRTVSGLAPTIVVYSQALIALSPTDCCHTNDDDESPIRRCCEKTLSELLLLSSVPQTVSGNSSTTQIPYIDVTQK